MEGRRDGGQTRQQEENAVSLFIITTSYFNFHPSSNFIMLANTSTEGDGELANALTECECNVGRMQLVYLPLQYLILISIHHLFFYVGDHINRGGVD